MWRLLALSLVFASPVRALELSYASATETAREESVADSVRLPRRAWTADLIYPETQGAIRRRVLQVNDSALTTLQLLEPLRTILQDAGYKEVFSCADRACGGFDFRFQLDLLPPPAMFVDLGNYRYLLMENEAADAKLVSIVASSSATAGFLHITEVLESTGFQPKLSNANSEPVRVETDSMITALVQNGHVVLGDLDFATGSAELGAGPFPSLRKLADWLSATPGARIALVGHTDSVGSLDANLALSRKRASSVLSRLVDGLGVTASQVTSDGAGALSPIASNLTSEGRALNRRVEVVLLTIE